MDATATVNPPLSPVGAPTAARSQQGTAAPDRLGDLREQVDRLVGSFFYGTLLRNLRGSVLQGEIGHGGRGEEVFQAQLDQVLAERAASASTSSLNEGVYRRLAAQQERMADISPRAEQI